MNGYTEADIRRIVQNVITQFAVAQPAQELVPVEASARHVHLTREAVEALFGKDAKLTPKTGLSQPGEFLSDLRVMLVTNKGALPNVAVLGPERPATQVELSLTDGRALGIHLPINISGDLNGAADVLIVGTAGIWEAKGAAIAAKAHIHMTPEDAVRYGVQDGETVSLSVENDRVVTFGKVVVRVSPKYSLAAHIDVDEANACKLEKGTKGMIRKSSGKLIGDIAPIQQTKKTSLLDNRAGVWSSGSNAVDLITESMALDMVKTGGTIQLKRKTIMTPSARDVFIRSKADVLYDT